jgi:hypothetical protein
MTSLLAGVVGGIVATIVMTVFMLVLGDDGPPPTARLVARFADGTPEQYEKPGMALHFLYGLGAGVVFAVGVPLAGVEFGSLLVAAVLGLAYAVVLTVLGMVFWMRIVIGAEPDTDMMRLFVIVHVVYGLVLGGVVGSGVLG